MSLYFNSTVNVAFYSSHSFNTVIANTSPYHQTCLAFRALFAIHFPNHQFLSQFSFAFRYFWRYKYQFLRFCGWLNTVSVLSSFQNGFQTTTEKLSTFASTQLDISTDTQRTNTSENLSDIWKVTSPSTVSTEYEKTVGISIEFVHTYPRWIVIYLAKIARSL